MDENGSPNPPIFTRGKISTSWAEPSFLSPLLVPYFLAPKKNGWQQKPWQFQPHCACRLVRWAAGSFIRGIFVTSSNTKPWRWKMETLKSCSYLDTKWFVSFFEFLCMFLVGWFCVKSSSRFESETSAFPNNKKNTIWRFTRQNHQLQKPPKNQLLQPSNLFPTEKSWWIHKFLELKWPLFLKVNPPKQGLFQPKQGSFRFQVQLKSTQCSSLFGDSPVFFN